MKTLRFLLVKEFKQVFRSRAILPMILVMPFFQLLILPMAADFEIKNINIAVVDHDRSEFSQELREKVLASGYFRLTGYGHSFDEAYHLLEHNDADLILEIPDRFESELSTVGVEKVFVAVNAINGVKGSLGSSYVNAILSDFSREKATLGYGRVLMEQPKVIEVRSSNWFNAYLNYQIFMVPGILVMLVTMVGAYMCSMNIVREKEVGTIEQINVTPIKKHIYILGKMIPFWIIGMVVFSIGFFIVARLIYGIIPVGSVLLLYGFLAIFLFAMVGFGLLISTYSQTQQQAMSLVFFFMLIFVLMSGLFTTVESMPGWAQVIAYANPVTYFIEVMRMVALKGSGWSDITRHFGVMGLFAVVFNLWAVVNYRKTS